MSNRLPILAADIKRLHIDGDEAIPKVDLPIIAAQPFIWREPADIPRRDWLFGRHYIRDYATATAAQGGRGKTTLSLTEALSMVTGRNLLGVEPNHRSLAVWIWNLEDPRDEIDRRIAAAVVHHRIDPKELVDKLFVNSGREMPLVIAKKVKDTITVLEPVIDALVAEIKSKKIDVLVVDPFVSSHGLPENDNAAIDAAVKAWGRVAGWGNCAVELVHHTRKANGEAISVDSVRGGSAFVDGCRAVRVINGMSHEEAMRLGIGEPARFFTMSAGKQNMAPPGSRRDWYQLVSVELANGDDVQAIERWAPPDPFDDVTPEHLRKVQSMFVAGNYRENDQSPDWGGYAVAVVLGLDAGQGRKAPDRTGLQKAARAKIKRILQTWQANNVIAIATGLDGKRNERCFYTSVGA